ncbi:MAG: aminotransferase DegT, partial [Chlorobiaceae bacterium]|nr:aminotransferase DegT [Chlorobiaceae bacterium]
ASSTAEREQIMEALKRAGIPSVIYYRIPLHLQKAYAGLGYVQSDFPISEDFSARIFSLPMHPYLKQEDIDIICDVIVATA